MQKQLNVNIERGTESPTTIFGYVFVVQSFFPLRCKPWNKSRRQNALALRCVSK